MSLISRLAGLGDPEINRKLPLNTFWAVMHEIRNERIGLPDVIAHYGFDEGEQAELVWLMTRYAEQPDAAEKLKFLDYVLAIFMLAEGGFPGYTNEQGIIDRINAIGVAP